jgi:hypothetical protein
MKLTSYINFAFFIFNFSLLISLPLPSFAQKITVSDLTIEDGSASALTINLSNAKQFNAAGMYIELPEGFYFQLPQIGSAAEGTSQTLASKEQQATLLKFALIDTENNAPFSQDGSLLTAPIACELNVASGEYTGKLRIIELSKSGDNTLTTLPDQTFTIKVTHLADDIRQLSAGDSAPVQIYDAAGQQQPTVHKGFYIYKLSNGETKKVVVK